MPAPHNATTVTAITVTMPSITGLRGLYAIADTGVLAPRLVRGTVVFPDEGSVCDVDIGGPSTSIALDSEGLFD
jgi:hypothetical protein